MLQTVEERGNLEEIQIGGGKGLRRVNQFFCFIYFLSPIIQCLVKKPDYPVNGPPHFFLFFFGKLECTPCCDNKKLLAVLVSNGNYTGIAQSFTFWKTNVHL